MNKQKLIDTLVQSEKQNGLLAVLQKYFCSDIRVSIGYTSKACLTAIDELSFSVRSQNALKRASLFTIGDVIDAIENGEIEKIRNLGSKSICEIKSRVLLFGFNNLSEREKSEFFSSLIELNPEKTERLCEVGIGSDLS